MERNARQKPGQTKVWIKLLSQGRKLMAPARYMRQLPITYMA
jgi:hypothetical protein